MRVPAPELLMLAYTALRHPHISPVRSREPPAYSRFLLSLDDRVLKSVLGLLLLLARELRLLHICLAHSKGSPSCSNSAISQDGSVLMFLLGSPMLVS